MAESDPQQEAPAESLFDARVRTFAAITSGDFIVDKGNMYIAPLPISSGAEDRTGERIDQDGINVEKYRQNPVVFFVHSHKSMPLVPPVGQAVRPDGTFDCFRVNDPVLGDVWKSGCTFSQATKFAAQIFALVAEGTVRGRSIGAIAHKYVPYKPTSPGMAFVNGQIRPARMTSVICKSAELYEWSWTPIPCNSDAVIALKSMLSHGVIDGMPIDPMLGAFMKSFDLSEPVQSRGFGDGLGFGFTKGDGEDGDAHWVSLPSGTPILIDGEGDIKAGPAGMEGNVDDLGSGSGSKESAKGSSAKSGSAKENSAPKAPGSSGDSPEKESSSKPSGDSSAHGHAEHEAVAALPGVHEGSKVHQSSARAKAKQAAGNTAGAILAHGHAARNLDKMAEKRSGDEAEQFRAAAQMHRDAAAKLEGSGTAGRKESKPSPPDTPSPAGPNRVVAVGVASSKAKADALAADLESKHGKTWVERVDRSTFNVHAYADQGDAAAKLEGGQGPAKTPREQVNKQPETDLSRSDKKTIESTRKLREASVNPITDRKAADELSRNAAEIVNQAGSRTGHTVYGSTYPGLEQKEGSLDSAQFAGVAYGSGAKKADMNRGLRALEDAGIHGKIVDDENFKGIVVSGKGEQGPAKTPALPGTASGGSESKPSDTGSSKKEDRIYVGDSRGKGQQAYVATEGRSIPHEFRAASEIKVGDARVHQTTEGGKVYNSRDPVVAIDPDTGVIHFASGHKEKPHAGIDIKMAKPDGASSAGTLFDGDTGRISANYVESREGLREELRNAKGFTRAAEAHGYRVKEVPHPSGEGTHLVATDSEGNRRGKFTPGGEQAPTEGVQKPGSGKRMTSDSGSAKHGDNEVRHDAKRGWHVWDTKNNRTVGNGLPDEQSAVKLAKEEADRRLGPNPDRVDLDYTKKLASEIYQKHSNKGLSIHTTGQVRRALENGDAWAARRALAEDNGDPKVKKQVLDQIDRIPTIPVRPSAPTTESQGPAKTPVERTAKRSASAGGRDLKEAAKSVSKLGGGGMAESIARMEYLRSVRKPNESAADLHARVKADPKLQSAMNKYIATEVANAPPAMNSPKRAEWDRQQAAKKNTEKSFPGDNRPGFNKHGLLKSGFLSSPAVTSAAGVYGDDSMRKPVVGVVFNEGTTPADAEQFLKDSSDFLRHTPIELDRATGLYKSMQANWNGPTRMVADPTYPGVKFLMPGSLHKGKVIEPESDLDYNDTGENEEDYLEEPEVKDDATVAKEHDSPEMVVAPGAGPVKPGKPGARFMEAFERGLSELHKMAEAALEDVEQADVLEEAQKSLGILRDVSTIMKATGAKVYGPKEGEEPAPGAVPVPEGGAVPPEDAPEEKPVSPETLKALFYGDKVFVPSVIARSVQRIARARGAVAVDKAVSFLGRSLSKGFTDGNHAAADEIDPSVTSAHTRLAMARLTAAQRRAELKAKS